MACRYPLTAASSLPARWSWNASNNARSASGGAALLPVFDQVAVIPSDSVKELLPGIAAQRARCASWPRLALPKDVKSIAKTQFPYDSRASRRPCAEQTLLEPGSLQRPQPAFLRER